MQQQPSKTLHTLIKFGKWMKMVNFSVKYERLIIQHDMGVGQRKYLSPRQELNPYLPNTWHPPCWIIHLSFLIKHILQALAVPAKPCISPHSEKVKLALEIIFQSTWLENSFCRYAANSSVLNWKHVVHHLHSI